MLRLRIRPGDPEREIALAAAYTPGQISAMRPRSELVLRERENWLLRNLTATAARDVPMHQLWERQLRENPFQTRYPGGESVADVTDRLREFRGLLIEHHSGESVLVFCHVVVMRAMHVLLLRQNIEQAIATSRMPIVNTAVHAYRPSATGWTCERFNPTQHERPATSSPH